MWVWSCSLVQSYAFKLKVYIGMEEGGLQSWGFFPSVLAEVTASGCLWMPGSAQWWEEI